MSSGVLVEVADPIPEGFHVDGNAVNQDSWGCRRPLDMGAGKLTAPVITETQQAGLQPPKYPFATPKKPSPACRSCTSSFDI
jgi:hypothetical protein